LRQISATAVPASAWRRAKPICSSVYPFLAILDSSWSARAYQKSRTQTGPGSGGGTRRHGIGQQTFYRWKAKYGGLEAGDAQRLKALEDENRRLKRLVADLALDNAALKDVLSKNW